MGSLSSNLAFLGLNMATKMPHFQKVKVPTLLSMLVHLGLGSTMAYSGKKKLSFPL
jgi:hypothetical protein